MVVVSKNEGSEYLAIDVYVMVMMGDNDDKYGTNERTNEKMRKNEFL